MRAGAEENFRGFHHGFRKCGMWVDGLRDVVSQRRHFDGQNALRNQFSSAGTHNADAQHALGLWIDQKLGHAVGTVERNCASGCGPRELGNLNLAIFFFRLSFGEAGPGVGGKQSADHRGAEGGRQAERRRA